jgi:hypothetical protein
LNLNPIITECNELKERRLVNPVGFGMNDAGRNGFGTRFPEEGIERRRWR